MGRMSGMINLSAAKRFEMWRKGLDLNEDLAGIFERLERLDRVEIAILAGSGYSEIEQIVLGTDNGDYGD